MIFKWNQTGETLIEVVIAAAIMSGVTASAMNIANLTYRIGMHARERTEAIYAVQSQAEKLMAYRDHLEALNPVPDPLNPLFSNTNFPCALNGTDCLGHVSDDGQTFSAGAAANTGRYSVTINVQPGDSLSRKFIISANWIEQNNPDPATNQVSSEVRLHLVDKRQRQVIDCSIAGCL